MVGMEEEQGIGYAVGRQVWPLRPRSYFLRGHADCTRNRHLLRSAVAELAQEAGGIVG